MIEPKNGLALIEKASKVVGVTNAIASACSNLPGAVTKFRYEKQVREERLKEETLVAIHNIRAEANTSVMQETLTTVLNAEKFAKGLAKNDEDFETIRPILEKFNQAANGDLEDFLKRNKRSF